MIARLTLRSPADTIPSAARPLVLGFELADHSLGLVVEGGDDLVGVLFRVVKSQVYKALEMLTRWPLFRRARPPERTWDIIAW